MEGPIQSNKVAGISEKFPDTTKSHKEGANIKAKAGIITLSDSRTMAEDTSGHLIKELLENKGHEVVFHEVVKDSKEKLKEAIEKASKEADLIITNGGTGIAKKDITPETVEEMFDKKLTSFGALYSMLSYDDVGAAAVVSRATAGIINNTAVFCMPGSPKAVKLGMEKLIMPEIGHLVKHLGD